MATITPETEDTQWQETDRRVRHPLHTVRIYIRTYVLLEGLVHAVLFVAVACWLGLLVDWGLFRLFSFDWLLELEYLTSGQGSGLLVRVMILFIFLVWLLYIVVRKCVLRLFGEFSDQRMALLLERRFPLELRDRLITAVELADPKLAKKYGYSYPLVAKTIHAAAQRVESLPVRRRVQLGPIDPAVCRVRHSDRWLIPRRRRHGLRRRGGAGGRGFARGFGRRLSVEVPPCIRDLG